MTTNVITTTAEVRIAPIPMTAFSQTNKPLATEGGVNADDGDGNENDVDEDDNLVVDGAAEDDFIDDDTDSSTSTTTSIDVDSI